MQSNLKLVATLVTAGTFLACGQPAADASADGQAAVETVVETTESYKVNTETSQVIWRGSMLGMHSHEGTLKFSSGTIQVADGKIVGGEFVVDMSSINPTDNGYNEENPKEKLIGHLSSADFFDVENHPTASLSLNDNGSADLTVRGNTNSESVKGIEAKMGNGTMKATGSLTFDRTKYDVSFVHPMQDMVISNDIELNLEIAASK